MPPNNIEKPEEPTDHGADKAVAKMHSDACPASPGPNQKADAAIPPQAACPDTSTKIIPPSPSFQAIQPSRIRTGKRVLVIDSMLVWPGTVPTIWATKILSPPSRRTILYWAGPSLSGLSGIAINIQVLLRTLPRKASDARKQDMKSLWKRTPKSLL
jgi:hypothetical protein